MTMSKPKIFLSSACHGPNNDANCVGLCVRECLGTHRHARAHIHTYVSIIVKKFFFDFTLSLAAFVLSEDRTQPFFIGCARRLACFLAFGLVGGIF